MGIITRMRRQNAIYWVPGKPDEFGQIGVELPLVELVLGSGNFRVRWEDHVEEIALADETTYRSKARVYVPLLPAGAPAVEVQVGGWLYLGDSVSLHDVVNPWNNRGQAFEIKRFDKMPTTRATEFLRTAYL